MSKRLASAIFALLFALTAFVPALAAAETPAPSGAPEAEPSEKEEVIYFNLDASGKVESAYAVNSFPGGDIRDYGDYSEVRVLNTSDEITLDGDEVRLSSDAARVYYQGTLKDPRLPWDISLTYKLDGKAVLPGGARREIRLARDTLHRRKERALRGLLLRGLRPPGELHHARRVLLGRLRPGRHHGERGR